MIRSRYEYVGAGGGLESPDVLDDLYSGNSEQFGPVHLSHPSPLYELLWANSHGKRSPMPRTARLGWV